MWDGASSPPSESCRGFALTSLAAPQLPLHGAKPHAHRSLLLNEFFPCFAPSSVGYPKNWSFTGS